MDLHIGLVAQAPEPQVGGFLGLALGFFPGHAHRLGLRNGTEISVLRDWGQGREGRILLVKLGAAGDVLRTTPLLRVALP